MSNSSPAHPSNVRVFVHWKESTVFAGEEIECQITFKNISTAPASSLHPPNSNVTGAQRKSNSHFRAGSPLNPHTGYAARGHRSTASLNIPAASLRSQLSSNAWSPRSAVDSPREDERHKRSVSIISIGAGERAFEERTSQGTTEGIRRPSRGHGRSASLQTVPRGLGINGGLGAAQSQRTSTQPAPFFTFPSPTLDHGLPDQPPRRRSSGTNTTSKTPNITLGTSPHRKGSGHLVQTFKFPESPTLSPTSGSKGIEHDDPNGSKTLVSMKDSQQAGPAKSISSARVLSPASISGTPRSSGEFYSLSNNSTETLASEYVPQIASRAPFNAHARRTSHLLSTTSSRSPETLMMGYAQVHGSFTLDGSLLNQTPFDDVKRKGVVGGQGGGVVGVESSKRDSGLLRGFGWGNIGESLGGLLGGSELSSMKDMRGMANSRSVPLLSTPQSILFVDLRLAAGESRIYRYSFRLPRGLPPSHRGKAIKISYKLVIGTQRPGGAKEQQVSSIDIPFRVLGSVNSYGELLGHDLMSPYIILRDQAQVTSIELGRNELAEMSLNPMRKLPVKPKKYSTSKEFLSYVNELLTRPRQNSSLGLLSPTQAPTSRRSSMADEMLTVKEAIDMAVLRSNAATETQQSANRFEIARGGKRVAVVMLPRPAYRLGDTITFAVSFADSEIPCYAVHMTLETSERVDHSIALRSEASILRVTRKIHATHSESTLFARRVVFSPTIPITATPEFITSGVSLDWKIRVEFVTPSLVTEGNEILVGSNHLLEELTRDDRGAVLAAMETLSCESFEIAVPVRIYGAVTNLEKDESSVVGLAV